MSTIQDNGDNTATTAAPSDTADEKTDTSLNGLQQQRPNSKGTPEKLKGKIKEMANRRLNERSLRSAQDYLDFVTLFYSNTKSDVGLNATPEEKAADRERRLAALTTKHRRVFSAWPRDPKGKVIEPGSSGKRAPNGIENWGNSLYDFYTVQRFPDIPGAITFTTGSKLLGWMKKNGEMYAQDQIAMAENEPDPREIHPWPVAGSFKDTDRRAKMSFSEDGVYNNESSPATRIEFGLKKPFAQFNPAPLLQEHLPFRLLPKKLIVHDPSLLLRAQYRDEELEEEPVAWDAKPDLVSVYTLHLSEDGNRKLKEEEEAITKQEEEDRKAFSEFLQKPTTENVPPGRGILVYTDDHDKNGPAPPALYFVHEATPVKKPVEESHAYLSPHHLMGIGNHSYALQADWEIPRSMVVPDYLCEICIIQKGMRMVVEEDGPKGETKDPKWKELSGEVVDLVDFFPGVAVSIGMADGEEFLGEDGEEVCYDIMPRRHRTKKEYRGPLRVVHTGIGYQNPEDGPLCEHLAQTEQPPSLTASVRVVAKLSYPWDRHLEHEAVIYQAFPDHFFHHYTGYNQLPPLHDPFPIGALVPQFFGYYVPDDDIPPMIFDRKVPGSGLPGKKGMEKWKETDVGYGPHNYRSRIMLLEDCGQAIPSNVKQLSIDERETCASLFLRMHHAGWVQGSPHPRNILMQPGPIDTYPLDRMVNAMSPRHDLRKTTFRLIDFGRSQQIGCRRSQQSYFERSQHVDRWSLSEEENRVLSLMHLLHYDF